MIHSIAPTRGLRPLSAVASLTMVATMAVAVTGPAAATPGPSACTGGVVQLISDVNFQINSSGGDDANYIGYAVTPTSAVANLWVGLATSGSIVSLAPGQPAVMPSGPVAASATTYSYFLAKATGVTTTAQPHTVTLYDGNPAFGGSVLCTYAGQITRVDDTITANANKVTSIAVAPAGAATAAQLGQEITVTAVGDSGTIGNGPAWDTGVINLSPASLSSFPAGAWRLIDVTLTTNPGTPAQKISRHDLHFANAATDQGPYTAAYTFRAVGASSASANVMPIQYIASGTQVKRTGSLPATLPTVGKVTNTLEIAKTATPTTLGPLGGDVVYTVEIANNGDSTVTIDDIADLIPVGATYKAGSAVYPVEPMLQVSSGATTLVFPGPLEIAAKQAVQFDYTLTIPAAPGHYVNSVVAWYGAQKVTATGGGLPASVDVIVGSPAPIVDELTDSTAYTTAITVTPVVHTAATISARCLVDPANTSLCTDTVTVVGEGTWTLGASPGDVTFTPVAHFAGDTTPVTFRVTDNIGEGQSGENTMTITVDKPAAPSVDAIAVHTAFGTAKTVSPVVTGTDVDPALTCVVDASDSSCVSELVVIGKGTFTVAPNGDVTFTPAAGYAGAVPTVTLRVTDEYGQSGSNTIDIYVDPDDPVAAPLSGSTPAKTAVTLLPSVTGAGVDYATTCVRMAVEDACVTLLVVPDEGTWTVAPMTGAITFTPLATFDGRATAPYYDVTTTFGGHACATVTVTVGKAGPVLPPAMKAAVPFRHTAVLQAAPTLGTRPIAGYCIEVGSSCVTTARTAKGTWTVGPTGRVTFVPASTFYGVAGPMALRVTDTNGLTATSAMTVTVGKPALHSITQTVFFTSGSARVSPYSVYLLRRLAAKVPRTGTMGLRVKVTGYVQPTRTTSNDYSLSTRRAVNVSVVLKGTRLGGTYVVSGLGRATQTGPIARRVVVIISWYA